jgi:glycosyltransferase involved in cell wall biosynthesis
MIKYDHMLSAVVPAYNEEESVEAFYKVLVPNLSKLDSNYEVVFVDDGSTDSTLQILKKLSAKDKHVRIYSFRKNHGKAEALTLGFQMANGDFVVTLDADLQDRPEEIHKLLEKLKEGYDLVSGWRKNRKDSKLFINLPSKLFNFLAGAFWGLKLKDYNCGLKAYTRKAAKSLNLYGGRQRFIPLLLYQNGFRVTEIPVEHEKRLHGKSKYGPTKSLKEFPDMFTMIFLSKYAKNPLHFFGYIGSVVSAIGFLILIYLTILHFLGQKIGDRPLLTLGMLLVLAGFQVLFTGFLADLILHIVQTGRERTFDSELKYNTD